MHKLTYCSCAGIEAILNQFFGDRAQVNDNLAGLNLVDLGKLKLANAHFCHIIYQNTHGTSLDSLDGRHSSSHVIGEVRRVSTLRVR